MSIRGIPGHALMQAFHMAHHCPTPAERLAHLQRFGIEADDEVLLFLGHSDLDNVCCLRYQETLRSALTHATTLEVARTIAAALEPLLGGLRQAGARPVLYGCCCHDEIKQGLATLCGLTYLRCAACGGEEGAVIVRAPAATAG